MKIVGIIPARYKSSRFEGKPLADICGKPMIWWVWHKAIQVKDFWEVYVATDDVRIKEACEKYKINVIMTDSHHATGTDRIAEVAERIDADLYVNIQGDEPLIEPDTIREAILPFYNENDIAVTNLMTEIRNPVDVINSTIPKVITNKDNIGIFLSRCPVPFPKGKLEYKYYKQVCVYGFKPAALKFYSDYGKKYGKAKIEAIEDIEILRFIENGYKVQFIEVTSDTVAVDTIKDLEKVCKILEGDDGE